MKWTARRRDSRGFSLIEILVAFAVLSLALGVLLRIFGGGGHVAKLAEDYYRALITAESLLSQLGMETPVTPGNLSGVTPDGYRWSIQSTPYPMDPRLTGGMEGAPTQSTNLGFIPLWVELEVEWGPEEDPRAFTLNTLRLAPESSLR